jgi:hypothetical protein
MSSVRSRWFWKRAKSGPTTVYERRSLWPAGYRASDGPDRQAPPQRPSHVPRVCSLGTVCVQPSGTSCSVAVVAAPGDTVLIAGKGHESYQEIHGVRLPFDDCREARGALDARG